MIQRLGQVFLLVGWIAIGGGVGVGVGVGVVRAEDAPINLPKSRHFTLDYSANITGLKPGQVARVWLPIPPSDADQRVTSQALTIPDGAKVSEATEERYGNRIWFCEAVAPADGRLPIRMRYNITRREIHNTELPKIVPAGLRETQRRLHLEPDRRGPITGPPLELLKGVPLPKETFALARTLYNVVDDHVKYDKSRPGYGTGDVLWVCESGFGNCCDFHGLFMALARSQKIPARFEIGFPIPDDRGKGAVAGYHCWAYFHDMRRGWVPVDISEADKHPDLKEYYFGNLTENRVTFSRGRDLELIPKQAGDPLNYLVYPYVEVEGQPLDKEQVSLNFSYADVK